MDVVRMRHDGVEGEISVAPSAVAAMIRAGWEEAPEPPPTPPKPHGTEHDQPGAEPGTSEPGHPAGQTDTQGM